MEPRGGSKGRLHRLQQDGGACKAAPAQSWIWLSTGRLNVGKFLCFLAEHCPHCQKALRGVRATSTALAAAAGAALLGLAYAWGRAVAPLAPASLALLAGLGLALVARNALQKLERKFYFTDWRHGDHSG